ncbi:MAG: calcium/sodium antiporter [Rhizobiaceae bacterium]
MLSVAGLVLLFVGGEMLLRGAVGIAHRLAMSELLIGLTVVGFGTSMPELLVSVKAATSGQAELALGNVVGSNIANILLIGGAAILVYPALAWDRSIRRDAIAMVSASVILMALAATGNLHWLSGICFLLALAAYLCFAYYSQNTQQGAESDVAANTPPLPVALLLLAIGFVGLFFGADLLVKGATGLARDLGVSEAVIGLTIVAVGTSLPELATSLTAAFRGKPDVAFGNIVGSNIFNILGILGITAMVANIPVASTFTAVHIPLMLAVSVGFALMLVYARSIGRFAGGAMLALFAAYNVSLFTG